LFEIGQRKSIVQKGSPKKFHAPLRGKELDGKDSSRAMINVLNCRCKIGGRTAWNHLPTPLGKEKRGRKPIELGNHEGGKRSVRIRTGGAEKDRRGKS